VSKQIIEIIVLSSGQTQVETKGFAGGSCREASRFIEEALGQKTTERLTAEYHTSSNADHIHQSDGGPANG
jgi:hypothetical protein